MRLFYRSIIFALILCFCSCAQIQFKEFKVESCEIMNNEIKITFSSIPNQYLFVKAFSVNEDSKLITGKYKFNNCTVLFTPDNGIKDNYYYEIKISTDAEDINGISLLRDYVTSYTTRKEFERPCIKSTNPDYGSISTSDVTEIKIEFSEPIDVNSFVDSFSITPSFKYICIPEENDTVIKIKPTEQLKRNTRYILKITTNLMDKNRNCLLKTYETTFINWQDKTIPNYELFWKNNGQKKNISDSEINTNLPFDIDLVIEFDKQIETSYINNYIELVPPVEIEINSDELNKNKTMIRFVSGVEWEQDYTLKIRKGIKDIFDNEIKYDKEYKLRFNNEKNRPIKVEKVLLDLKDNTETRYAELTDYCTKTFKVENFPITGVDVSTNLYFIFEISSQATAVLDLSLMNSFSTEYSNGCFNSFITRSIKIITAEDIQNDTKLKEVYDSISTQGGKLCVAKIELEIRNSSTANIGILTLKLDSSTKDNLGNKLNNKYVCRINKQ